MIIKATYGYRLAEKHKWISGMFISVDSCVLG